MFTVTTRTSSRRWTRVMLYDSQKLLNFTFPCLQPDLQNILRQSYNNAKVMIDI